TLPYKDLAVARNNDDYGGEDNSFTPGYIPNMARTIWRQDYSVEPDDIKWIFIHEMTHVWQSYHNQHNIINGIKLYIKHRGNYDAAYYYDLDHSGSLYDYNMEQQAYIIPDWWLVPRGGVPKYNARTRKVAPAYLPFYLQLLASGAPTPPLRLRDG